MSLNAPVLHYEAVPDLLAEYVIGFKESPEYRQEHDYAPFPGIALAALARYLTRMKREPDRRPELASGIHAIEQLVLRGDSQASNAVITEFFHAVVNDPAELLDELGPFSRRLYDRWAEWPDNLANPQDSSS